MGHEVAKIDAKPLRDLICLHGLEITEIAKRTKISLSALYAWERDDKMPAYMEWVCLGVLSAIKGQGQKASGEGQPPTMIVRLPKAGADMAFKVLDAIGAKYRSIDELF